MTIAEYIDIHGWILDNCDITGKKHVMSAQIGFSHSRAEEFQ